MTVNLPQILRRARHHCRLIAGTVAVLLGICQGAQGAQSVYLTWNPSTSPGVVSYKVYFGTQSRVYPNAVAFGVTNSATIPGLQDGAIYYFATTAVTTNGSESPYSNETNYTTPFSTANISLSVIASTQALAAVELTWTASPDSDVYGYAVNYWTDDSGYTNVYT